MILYRDWTITSDGLLARQYDNLSRRVEVVGELPAGWSWELLVQVGGAMDIIPLNPIDGGVGHTLTAEQVSIDGYYTVQLRGRRGEMIRHTNTTQVFVSKSLSGTAQWPSIPSEFTELEQRMWELNNHPPVPGQKGFWLIWNPVEDRYEESTVHLPQGSGSPFAVQYTPQTLEAAEQAQARANINAMGKDELPPAVAEVAEGLPTPTDKMRGKFLLVPDGDSDKLYICMRVAGVFTWVDFDTIGTGGEDTTITTSVLGVATLGTMILGG